MGGNGEAEKRRNAKGGNGEVGQRVNGKQKHPFVDTDQLSPH
jgi:hypothetical protein